MTRKREEEELEVVSGGSPAEARGEGEEPPVVARLMVEIRSDGRRTIARGAMEDAESGQKVAVEATGTTPLSLAASLAKSMFRLPAFARGAARTLLSGGRGGRRR